MHEELADALRRGRVSAAWRHIHKQEFLSRSEFVQLLASGYYSSALYSALSQYESRDRSPQQLLLTHSLPATLPLCTLQTVSSPSSIDIGLHLLLRLRSENSTESTHSAVAAACEEALRSRVVVYSINPIATAVQVIVLLGRMKKAIKRKTQSHWEQFAMYYDRKAGKVLLENYENCYSAKTLSGRTVADLIASSENQSLLALKGFRRCIESEWRGTSQVIWLPQSVLIARLFGSAAPKGEQFWSFQHFYEACESRYYYSAFCNIAAMAIAQVAILGKLHSVLQFSHDYSATSEPTYIPIVAYDYVLVTAFFLSVAECSHQVCKFVYYSVTSHTVDISDAALCLSLLAAGSSAVCISSLSHFQWFSGKAQLTVLGMSLGLWVAINTFQILVCKDSSALRTTSQFALLTNSLVVMVRKSQAFSLLLFLLLYAFASQYQMFNLVGSVWAESIGRALYYGFVVMLGNLQLDRASLSANVISSTALILFVIGTTVIMLNLLVTVLSEVYYDSLRSVKRVKTALIRHQCQRLKASKRLGWLNCTVPPVSMLSLLLLPALIWLPNRGKQASKALVAASYYVSLFPIAVVLKAVLDAVLIVPAFCVGFRSFPLFNQAQIADSDTVLLTHRKRPIREHLMWAVCGLPKLLKIALSDTVQYAAAISKVPRSLSAASDHSERSSHSHIDRQPNSPTDCTLENEDPKAVYPREWLTERLRRCAVGFEGEEGLRAGAYRGSEHFASVEVGADEYETQALGLMEHFHPRTVFAAVEKVYNKKKSSGDCRKKQGNISI